MINLSENQLQDTIHSILNKDEGLNELLEMILNGLMKLERDTFLSDQASPDNKGNGYRPGHGVATEKSCACGFPATDLGTSSLCCGPCSATSNSRCGNFALRCMVHV